MRDLTITAIIKVYQYDELNEGDRSLIKTAMEATAPLVVFRPSSSRFSPSTFIT